MREVPLWRCADLRALDERALQDLPWLMEVAGAGLADVVVGVLRQLASGLGSARVELWLGPGNNGGDGLVAIRHLAERNVALSVWAPMGMPAQGDAGAAHDRLMESGQDVHVVDTAFESEPDVVVDCLFGTGLNRPLDGVVAEAARSTHETQVVVVACDIPSGLCGDTGRALGDVVAADVTVTFGGLKPGFFCADGLDCCGKVRLCTLGYRQDHYEGIEPVAWLDHRPASHFVHRGASADHKGRYGRVMVFAGSPGMEGAALLALNGARMGGAGLVHLWAASCRRADLPDVSAEVMVAPFAEHALEAAADCDAVVAGPGLGRTPEARDALLKLLAAAPDAAWVLDADALWHLADQPYDLPEHCVLTPHEGEALRLLGEDPLTGSWGGDRLELVDALAARYGVHVLLKGAGNLLASEGHTVLIPGSARALARGGSGDLLAGLIGALSARGARLEDAVHLAVRLQLQAAAGLSAGRAEVVSQEHLATLMGEAWQVLHES